MSEHKKRLVTVLCSACNGSGCRVCHGMGFVLQSQGEDK